MRQYRWCTVGHGMVQRANEGIKEGCREGAMEAVRDAEGIVEGREGCSRTWSCMKGCRGAQGQ